MQPFKQEKYSHFLVDYGTSTFSPQQFCPLKQSVLTVCLWGFFSSLVTQ